MFSTCLSSTFLAPHVCEIKSSSSFGPNLFYLQWCPLHSSVFWQKTISHALKACGTAWLNFGCCILINNPRIKFLCQGGAIGKGKNFWDVGLMGNLWFWSLVHKGDCGILSPSWLTRWVVCLDILRYCYILTHWRSKQLNYLITISLFNFKLLSSDIYSWRNEL